ncbi:MAG: GNAT family N-acetyltransferase [Haloferacaceae archaeon]|nr:GNAT family N-acetyltransferase [Haloferacaceae archaeon]
MVQFEYIKPSGGLKEGAIGGGNWATYVEDKKVVLFHLWIEPLERNAGFGSMIIENITQEAQQANLEEFVVHIGNDGNTARFLKRRGFVVDSVDEPSVIATKKLDHNAKI